MRSRRVALGAVVFGLFACTGEAEPNHGALAPLPHPEVATAEPESVAKGTKEAVAATPALAAPADPNEACARAVVIAYKGAKYAPAEITRDKDAAKSRAEKLLGELQAAPTRFDAMARSESDAPTSAGRGGYALTARRDDFPALHAALQEPLFKLKVNEFAPGPVEADYGYVVLQRCPVEKAHSRHILIRYKGAKRAPDDIKRSKAEAKALAEDIKAKLDAGADFEQLAKKASEDSSAERGGDLGDLGRGLLAPAFESTLFELDEGAISDPVESDFGFHVIQRLPLASK